jgi:hypothetical protein
LYQHSQIRQVWSLLDIKSISDARQTTQAFSLKTVRTSNALRQRAKDTADLATFLQLRHFWTTTPSLAVANGVSWDGKGM